MVGAALVEAAPSPLSFLPLNEESNINRMSIEFNCNVPFDGDAVTNRQVRDGCWLGSGVEPERRLFCWSNGDRSLFRLSVAGTEAQPVFVDPTRPETALT